MHSKDDGSLDDRDYLDILRHIQKRLQEVEPDIFESLAKTISDYQSSRERTIEYLHLVIATLKERSRHTYHDVLRSLNEHILSEQGEGIRRIVVELSPQEQEVYRVKEIDLARFRDHSKLVHELLDVVRELSSDSDRDQLQ